MDLAPDGKPQADRTGDRVPWSKGRSDVQHRFHDTARSYGLAYFGYDRRLVTRL